SGGRKREQQGAAARWRASSPGTASVLLARGVGRVARARAWLSPHHTARHGPFLLPDMEKAIERLHRAVAARERICFSGDYDVDGIAATSLYLSFFGNLGADTTVYIPDRVREGYGLHERAL